MSAKTDLLQTNRGLELDLVPSDPALQDADAEMASWTEETDRPPTRTECRGYAIVPFGLQGVVMLAVATLIVAPFVFVPSCSAKAWPILKAVLVMDVIAYLVLAGGLLLFVDRGLRSSPDAA